MLLSHLQLPIQKFRCMSFAGMHRAASAVPCRRMFSQTDSDRAILSTASTPFEPKFEAVDKRV